MQNPLSAARQAALANHPFFRGLPALTIERLAAYAHLVQVRRGEAIFCKGDEGEALFSVIRGTVRISVPSEEGKEIVLNLIGPGEVFGEIALLDAGRRTADAIASTEVELLSLHRREFVSFLAQEPNVALKLLELLAKRLRRTSEQVEDLSFSRAPRRLAKTILALAESQPLPVRIGVTQRALGDLAGLSRESTNKQLRVWQKLGIIGLTKGELELVDPEALRQLELVRD